jgi:membrane protein
LSKVPTYSVVYGAFATVPILLVWIYVAWVIVLLGAALTAYIPSLLAGVPRRRSMLGWQFHLALEVLQQLDAVRQQANKGLTHSQLCAELRVDVLRLEPVLEALTELDWIGQLTETTQQGDEARFILLTDPQTTLLEPLMQKLLLPPSETTTKLWKNGRWPMSTLREVL